MKVRARDARRVRTFTAPERVAWGLLVVLVLASVLAPWLPLAERDALNLDAKRQPPSLDHPFGTDELGRDVLSRVIHAGRVSLAVAGVSTLVAVVVGTSVGLAAGWFGGRIDLLLVGLVDVALALPFFLLLLVLASAFGGKVSVVCLGIGFATWMPVARLVRAATLTLRERDWVQAARALGFGSWRIVMRHVLPHTLTPMGVAALLGAAQALLLESALSFLGVGVRPPTPTWGNLLREAQDSMSTAPWMAVFPGAFIFLVVLALHLLGDALQRATDPRLRRSRAS